MLSKGSVPAAHNMVRQANAGGHCYRSGSTIESSREVWFNDAMTPRVDWLWDTNFRASASIRFHCWRNCLCARDGGHPTGGNLTRSVWRFVYNHEMFATAEDGLAYRDVAAYDRTGGSMRWFQTIREPRGGSDIPSAGTCGADGRQFCVERWPTDILGPVPKAPPSPYTNETAPTSIAKCGYHCSSQQDCNTGEGTTICDCKEPSMEEKVRYGLDPVFPTWICVAAVTATVNKYLPGDLANRNLEPVKSHECRCNSTYISQYCCGSKDGMVELRDGE